MTPEATCRANADVERMAREAELRRERTRRAFVLGVEAARIYAESIHEIRKWIRTRRGG